MLEIVSDSSTLFNKAQAEEAGFHSVPLNVVVDSRSYKDFEDITAEEFVEKCRQKASVSTSQPSIGEKLDLYNHLLSNPDTKVLDITIADGLSGTYQTAMMAKEHCDDPNRVTVLNSTTLCGPQQGLVLKAIEMRDQGKDVDEIVETLEKMAKTDVSTVTCTDISYLQRSGRVGNLKGMVADILKLNPIVKKEPDGTTLSTMGAARTFGKVFDKVDELFKANGVNDDYTIYISHGDNPQAAKKAEAYFAKKYPNAKIETNMLCPMFISHGGPGCVSIQAINLKEQA